MALDKEARAVLFGTPMLAHQIRKCVQGKGSMPESELRSIFSDIDKSVFDHAVWKLVNRGVLARKDGEISFCPDAPAIRGNQADRAWKAACLLKSFRLEELCELPRTEEKTFEREDLTDMMDELSKETRPWG